MDELINKWYDEQMSVASLSPFHDKECELRAHIEQYTIELINIKETKFLRDQSAHDMGFAYKWNLTSQNHQRCSNKFSNPTPSNHTAHVPDDCSVSPSSSQSTVYQDIANERSSKKH